MLSILLVNVGASVRTDLLIDELWGDTPPKAARKTVQAHIAHLRKALNADGEVLTATNNGYVVRVDDDSIDAKRCEAMVENGRSLLIDHPRRAVTVLSDALDLFRGTPFSGVADDAFSLRVEATRLEELRMTAVEGLLEARLAVGDATRVITATNRLVAEHPLRERLWALQMLALYREGRQGEALQAYSRVRQVLAEELGIDPSPSLQDLDRRILEQDPTLTSAQSVGVVSRADSEPTVRNPYKGLRTFDENDAADFFGRDELVRRLRARLDARDDDRLMVLAGPSGGGKSSVVRAGLIPEMRQHGYEVVVVYPGRDPFGAVAKATAEVTGESAEEVLSRMVAGGAPAAGRLVVVLDQFEELFTMTDPDDADRFLDLLAVDNDRVQWVVTVRADFLDRILTHPVLGARLEEALVLVPPLQDHEVEAAVTRPARRVNVPVEPDLVAEIVRDVRSRPSALPLLQYSLTDTFERRRGDKLTLGDYRSSGGISGALSRRVDELYDRMDREEKEAIRQLLLSLVTVTEEGEAVRQRVDREMLMRLPAGREAVQQVVERLGAYRLLTFDSAPGTNEPTVEVAHEALISEWPRLARWVDDHHEDLRLRQRLSAASREWTDSGRERGFLMTGGRLEQFSGWAEVTDLELGALQKEYLESSLKESRAQEQRSSRIRRLIVGGLMVAVIVTAGLGLFALSERRISAEQARVVRAADLAAAAVSNLETDPELSILLAIEAVETTRMVDGTVLKVAEEVLHRAVLSHRLLGRVDHNGQGIAHFSPDGRSFVSSAEDPTTLQVWSADPFELKLTLRGHANQIIDAVFDPTGERIATTSPADGTVRVWASITGELVTMFDTDGANPAIPVFSNDGTRVAATDFYGPTRVWDLETGEVLELAPAEGTAFTLNLEFSPDDSLLAVARNVDGTTEKTGPMIYDLATGELKGTLEGHQGDVTDIGFTPDGARVVTSSRDGTVRVWDVESGETIGIYTGHDDSVQDLQISKDGSAVASSGSADVRVWDLETLETTATIVGHSGAVDGIDLSPGGDLLLTASNSDGTTRLWDLRPFWSHELAGLPGPALGQSAGLSYSPDGAILAASRDVDLVTLWDTSKWSEFDSFQSWNGRMEFGPDGSLLATAGFGGVKLHDLTDDAVADVLAGTFVADVTVGPRGLLVTGTSDGVRVWRPPGYGEGEVISTAHTLAVAIDPEARLVASAHQDDAENFWVEIREVDGGELVEMLSEHRGPVVGLAFDRSGERMVSVGHDATGIIWNTTSFTPLHRLEGHTAFVKAAAFDPTRPNVATGASDGSVKIWDVETGMLRLTLPAQGALTDVAYSPDGRHLAAISPEGFVTVYLLEVEELLEVASGRPTRGWSEAECLQYLQTDECLTSTPLGRLP
ncbi:hypothetical protein BH23ACT4_BH23ACT4_07530 [soil metagenome]